MSASRGLASPESNLLPWTGWSRREVIDLAAANVSFPLGVDCIFVDDAARTASVPRSARMEVA